MIDPYGPDVLRQDPHARPATREVPVEVGMVLEDPSTGFVGAVTHVEKSGGMHLVELEDRYGNRRGFPLGPGFWLDGQPIVALPPRPTHRRGPRQTNSGSRLPAERRARVAKQSRLWVEGRHDAELIQHVWGVDLAQEGVAVELLDGADHLEEVLEVFGPTDSARAGVLLDHLVPGSKETRIADSVRRRWGPTVLVLGHPFVDIWQAIKPARVGLNEWPSIPRSVDIKVGTLTHLGLPAANQADIAEGWQFLLSRVRTYRDLEVDLLRPVEQLIDFVTEPGTL
ncbi:DUF3097 family protein [Actinomyces sp. F1_1611]